jgi:hypothetical protein
VYNYNTYMLFTCKHAAAVDHRLLTSCRFKCPYILVGLLHFVCIFRLRFW